MSEEKQRIMLLERVSRFFVRLSVMTEYIKKYVPVKLCCGQLHALMQYSVCKDYKYFFRECFFIALLDHCNSLKLFKITIKTSLLAYPCYV